MRGDGEFSLVRVPELTGEMFDRFYHAVLESSFPPQELEDIGAVRAVHYEQSSCVPGLAALRGGDPVGGALGEHYGVSNIVLLAYLAVRADCRGGGIGSALLDRALSSWRELLAPAAILAEIEDPRGHSAGPHGDPVARLRFYERTGGKVLPLRYFQPSVGRGLPRVRSMFLICLDPWRESVPKDAVLAFLHEYMEAAEGPEAAAADPEYLNLRGQVNAWRDEIPLWPLSRATQLPEAGQLLIGNNLRPPRTRLMRHRHPIRSEREARETVSEAPRERRSFKRGRRRGLSTWSGWLVRSDSIVAIGTVVTVALTALTLHSGIVTGGVAIAGSGYVLIVLIVSLADQDRRRQRTLDKLARQIEEGPPGLDPKPLPQVKDSRRLVDDLEKRLEDNERLCVIRLRGKEILDVPPGIAEDAIPETIECQRIVGEISWKLEKARGLNEDEKEIAADLRGIISVSLRASNPLGTLRQNLVSSLRDYDLTDRVVPLVDARREALRRPAWNWLFEVFHELDCTYGVFIQEPGGNDPPPHPFAPWATRRNGRRYVSGMLKPWMSEDEFHDIFESLCAAVGSQAGLDMRLLKIRCAVIVAAAELDERAAPTQRLLHRDPVSSATPEGRMEEAALEVRWLVDLKAARIAGARGVTGVFDRLAVIGNVTPAMFTELVRDLVPGAEGTRKLYNWLRSDEFRLAGVVDSAEDAISLSDAIRDATRGWLKADQQSAAYQNAQIAVERCYRVCLVLDRTHVPAPGYADSVADGYAGLHLFEIPDWWLNVHAWCGHIMEIDSPEHRRDAGVAITCLFLETWWWWGDQLRLRFVADVLDLAGKILRDQSEWISALAEFDQNYVPEFDLRAAAGDRWRRVGNALGFLADNLGLRQGEVPADPVLARIYVCWCFFSGDVAQQTGSLKAADGWFRDAAEACGDDEDNAGMRAFACYQRADVWIASDTDRSMRLITETRLAEAAVELDDLALRANVARMYGDIRWNGGNIDEAFDAYGRALLLTYVYQVDQESDKMPPNAYSYSFYSEMRTRFLRRLGEARANGHVSEAGAGIERIRKLFGPYWELRRDTIASGEDPLAGVVPPLPDKAVLDTFDSDYARDAQLMLNGKLQGQVAEPVDRPLSDLEE